MWTEDILVFTPVYKMLFININHGEIPNTEEEEKGIFTLMILIF
jgi:hypothetical protein